MARPMFKYYGGKWKLAKYYGPPRRDLVVEPFAGSACYSLYWNCRNVKLYDKDDEVCQLWDYLINCSENDIKALPDWIENINELFELKYAEERLIVRWLYLCTPKKTPRTTDLAFYKRHRHYRKDFWGYHTKQRILRAKPLIADWSIDCCSYEDIPNTEAHWHIDPPYNSKPGQQYRHNSKSIDYNHLAEWSKERLGEVDVCEKEGADWLPFRQLKTIQPTTFRKSTYNEVYWSNREGIDKQPDLW